MERGQDTQNEDQMKRRNSRETVTIGQNCLIKGYTKNTERTVPFISCVPHEQFRIENKSNNSLVISHEQYQDLTHIQSWLDQHMSSLSLNNRAVLLQLNFRSSPLPRKCSNWRIKCNLMMLYRRLFQNKTNNIKPAITNKCENDIVVWYNASLIV